MSVQLRDSADYAIANILGVYCPRCERVTSPYIGEGKVVEPYSDVREDVWPCCSGCWKRYDWQPDAS